MADEYIIQGKTMRRIMNLLKEKTGTTDSMTVEQAIHDAYLIETETDIGAPASGVKFYDYDGTLLHEYTVKEARALTALPEGPIHEDLPFAGWTHTLAQVNAVMKSLDVGAMYEPEITKFYITLPNSTFSNVKINFSQSISNGVTINWGDGQSNSVSGTGNVTASHQYQYILDGNNDYVIELIVTSGTLSLNPGNDYLFGGATETSNSGYYHRGRAVTKMIIGKNVDISTARFAYCGMHSIVLPVGVQTIDRNPFYECKNLVAVIIPNTVTNIASNQSAVFCNCNNLSLVIIPEGMNRMNNKLFDHCDKMKNIIIPSSVTYINYLISRVGDEAEHMDVHIRRKVPPSATNEFFGQVSDITNYTIYVPEQSLEKYKSHSYWSKYSNIIKGEPVEFIN